MTLVYTSWNRIAEDLRMTLSATKTLLDNNLRTHSVCPEYLLTSYPRYQQILISGELFNKSTSSKLKGSETIEIMRPSIGNNELLYCILFTEIEHLGDQDRLTKVGISILTLFLKLIVWQR